jgi:hypothetical protein
MHVMTTTVEDNDCSVGFQLEPTVEIADGQEASMTNYFRLLIFLTDAAEYLRDLFFDGDLIRFQVVLSILLHFGVQLILFILQLLSLQLFFPTLISFHLVVGEGSRS